MDKMEMSLEIELEDGVHTVTVRGSEAALNAIVGALEADEEVEAVEVVEEAEEVEAETEEDEAEVA